MAIKKLPVDKWLKFKLGLTARITIYERLEAYVREGFPVYDSLLKFKTRYDKKKDFRAKIINVWLENLKHGLSLSQSIEGWIPDAELNLISAGEAGAGLENGLAEATRFAKSAQQIKSTIIGGAAYPLVLLAVVLGFIAMFSLQMAPTYLSILPLERWPDLGKGLYSFSKFLVTYWYIMIGSMIALSVVIAKTIGTWTGPTREFFDKIPPWSVYKVYQASAFLISLASMMKSGTPLNDGIKKIKSTSSPWVAEYMDDMLRNLRRGGKNFGQHLDVGLLDEETAGDVIDYSELGGAFEEAVYSIGEKNLANSVQKINLRMGLVRNLMIVLVGVTVGVIYYTSIELNSAVAESAGSSNAAQSAPKQ